MIVKKKRLLILRSLCFCLQARWLPYLKIIDTWALPSVLFMEKFPPALPGARVSALVCGGLPAGAPFPSPAALGGSCSPPAASAPGIRSRDRDTAERSAPAFRQILMKEGTAPVLLKQLMIDALHSPEKGDAVTPVRDAAAVG